jgi:glutamate--cysteine ligase
MEYGGPNLLSELQSRIDSHQQEISDWFKEKRANLPIPLYGSVDVRDANWKVAVVDANQYPAGFNNLDGEDADLIGEHLSVAIRAHGDIRHIHIYPESHTRNAGYVENLRTLEKILSEQGYTVTVGSPELSGIESVEGLSGSLRLHETTIGEGISVAGITPDLVLLNNDLTIGALPDLGVPILPPVSMGWHRRRKSDHFRAVQPFIDEIAAILDVDPWLLGTHWFVSEDKCLEKETCLTLLAAEVDEFLKHLQAKYDEYGITGKPTLFVKNDAGTYGLGILEITSGQELLDLSNRKMNRLTYGKGGVTADDFLLQEGIPSSLSFNDMVVEPVAYCANGKALAWFYRANSKKGEMSNLNSPSSTFISPREMEGTSFVSRLSSWHMLVAELAMLGMGVEAQSAE